MEQVVEELAESVQGQAEQERAEEMVVQKREQVLVQVLGQVRARVQWRYLWTQRRAVERDLHAGLTPLYEMERVVLQFARTHQTWSARSRAPDRPARPSPRQPVTQGSAEEREPGQ